MPQYRKIQTQRRRAPTKKTVPFHIILPSIAALAVVIAIIVCFALSMGKLSDAMSGLSQNILYTPQQNGLTIDPNAEQYKGQYIAEAQQGSVAIPGFETLKLKADSHTQTPGFHNPESNNCYFVIELRLSDGTTLYKSGLLAPGKAIYNARLSGTLSAGTYPASVIYHCYAMDGLSELNGAEIKITLEVS